MMSARPHLRLAQPVPPAPARLLPPQPGLQPGPQPGPRPLPEPDPGLTGTDAGTLLHRRAACMVVAEATGLPLAIVELACGLRPGAPGAFDFTPPRHGGDPE